MHEFMTMIGIIGSCGGPLMYFLYERGFIRTSDYRFFATNGIAAAMVMIAAAYEFDGGDLGVISQEFCWATISAAGLYRIMRARQNIRKEGF